MKPGHESRTAIMVCMGRAAAHGLSPVKQFSDPTALALLPEKERILVERFRAGGPPKGLGARFKRNFLAHHSRMMVARTVGIDEAIRSAATPQVVTLGAGLDGRAWRMAELRDVTVFEVDHPDSQRSKRARAAALTQVAREVRFVPVDFTRDDLGQCLTASGHDPTRPTTWVWEGVVMYLTVAEIEKTLAVIDQRSAAGSRLIIVYHSPALVLALVGGLLRRLGEPLRSKFTSEQMRALLAKYNFTVVKDRDLPTLAGELSIDLAKSIRYLQHVRFVTADRPG